MPNKSTRFLDFEIDKLTNSIENSRSGESFATQLIRLNRSDLINLLESSPINRGRSKLYHGVAGNLVAFACSLSFQRGHQGNVAFLAKTKLIVHYTETLGATHIGGGRMIIGPERARFLIDKYFK